MALGPGITLENAIALQGVPVSNTLPSDGQALVYVAASNTYVPTTVGSGSGTVTSITQGTGMSFSVTPITTTGTINLANTAVTPGTYTNATLTVDQQGRLTAASTGTSGVSTMPPQGRLTLQTGVPVMTSDQTAKGTIYYDSYVGNQVPVWNGTSMVALTIGSDEISCILDSTNQPISALYDMFAYSASGTLTLGAGPAWSYTATITVTIATPAVVTWTSHALPDGSPVIFTTTGALPTGITAGTIYFTHSTGANTFNISTSMANLGAGTYVATSGSQSGVQTGTNHTVSRGTGAGTTELQLKNGVWTNKNAITLFNNSVSSGSIAANRATYLGTFYTTAAAQTGMAFTPAAASGGSNNFLGVWNAYNRVPIHAQMRDSVASWTFNSNGTWRAADAGATGSGLLNRISWVDGLSQSFGSASYSVTANAGTAQQMWLGCAQNWASGGGAYNGISGSPGLYIPITAPCSIVPGLGLQYVQAIEATSGTNNATVNGSGTQILMLDLQM